MSKQSSSKEGFTCSKIEKSQNFHKATLKPMSITIFRGFGEQFPTEPRICPLALRRVLARLSPEKKRFGDSREQNLEQTMHRLSTSDQSNQSS